jgi:hypothetical protein
MPMWKSIVTSVIATVTATLIITFLIGRAPIPEAPFIEAKARWVDVRNPFYTLKDEQRENIKKLGEAIWGETIWGEKIIGHSLLGSVIEGTQHHYTLKILSLEINNTSNLRSKEVDVVGSGFVWYSDTLPDSDIPGGFRFKSIDPNRSIRVIGIGPPYDPFLARVFHADKVLPIQVESERFVWLQLLWAITTAFFIISFMGAILIDLVPALRAKITSKEEIEGVLKYLDYVKTRYPQKYPSSTNLNKSK